MNIQHLNGPSRGLWANIAPLFRALIFYVTARYLAMKLISSTVKEKAKSVYLLASLLSTASSSQQLCRVIRKEIQGNTLSSLQTEPMSIGAWFHLISCVGSEKQTFHCLPTSPAKIISYCIWNPWAKQHQTKIIITTDHLSFKHNSLALQYTLATLMTG